MKIIKQGATPEWSTQITCEYNNWNGGCGTVFEVEVADLYMAWEEDYRGDRYTVPAVNCPVCGKQHVVRDLPYYLQSKVRDA